MQKKPKYNKHINLNIQMFVNNWKGLKRKLEMFGYIPSNIHTFQYAKRVVTQYPNPIKLNNDERIDTYSLGEMIECMQKNDLVYVAFAYPMLDDFNVFYYKKQDNEIMDIVSDYHRGENRAKIETLNEVLDILRLAKLSYGGMNEQKYDKICDELELMEDVQFFSQESDFIIKEIQYMLNDQINEINDDLRQAKVNMVANDYFKYERNSINKISEITERVIRA
jgi:hypothetical protein